MRNKNYYLIGFTVLFIAFFALSVDNQKEIEEHDSNLNENLEIETPREITNPDEITIETPRPAWAGSMTNITIDELGLTIGSYTWDQAKNEVWCTQLPSGVYVIENVTIDASISPTGNGILINNSNDDPFIIRNCTITNANGPGTDHHGYAGGIKLINCSRGTIFNNTINDGGTYGCGILLYDESHNITVEENIVYSNDRHGILAADYSYNITIKNNTVTETSNHGIYLYNHCDNITVRDNTANGNGGYGIFVFTNCQNNTITNNTANGNSNDGIRLQTNCHYNNLTGNIAIGNSWAGVRLQTNSDFNLVSNNHCNYSVSWDGIQIENGCDNNTIIDNIVTNNGRDGIRLYSGCLNNTIENNTANGNGEDGIRLYDTCSNNTITNNTANGNNQRGISIFINSHNNTIINNNLCDNDYEGIYLENNCDDNKIIHNNASNTAVGYYQNNGIILKNGCDNNLIENNTCNDNEDRGIDLNGNCNNNFIINNTCNDNSNNVAQRGGIVIRNNCHNNIIRENTCNRNGEGIYLYVNCDDNIISYNIFDNNNYRGIYLHKGCDNNTIFNNTATNNQGNEGIVIAESCNDNNISQNYASGNALDGIALITSDYNTIFNNTCNNNFRHGTYYDRSDYNNISYNTANGNGDSGEESGIYLYNSDNNLIHNNTANGNYYSGIYLYSDCTNNNITNNVCNENDYGIFLKTDCHNNTIDNNTANDNSQYGIRLHTNCDDNNIINNFALNTIDGYDQIVGIRVAWNCDNNTYVNNTANGNTDSGISIAYYCIDSIIANNTCKNNGNGIEFYDYCENHIIENNTVNDNYQYGILLDNICNNNNITGNIVNNNVNGIYLYDCSFNEIKDNNVYGNSGNGTYLRNSCYNNTISHNNCSENGAHGISLFNNCHNNTIEENVASENSVDGIFFNWYCDDNKILGNNATGNSGRGLTINWYCDDNLIIGNNFSDNGDGIVLAGWNYYNTISGNSINDNGNKGLELYFRVRYNTITNNFINDNGGYGCISQASSNHNRIHNNTINGNNNGILIADSSDSCNLTHNIINDNNNVGVYITDSCHSMIIIGNILNNNIMEGIDDDGSNDLNAMNCIDGVCTPLIIDADGSTTDSFTWEEVLMYVPWFSGAGTLNDPYMIEGITVNASGDAVGLYIIDSQNVYFKIKDCTVYEAGSGSGYDAGIKLENTCNGTIINNIVSNNENNGICLMSGCQNNTITENTGIDNKDSGLRLQTDCDYNIISNNNFSYSDPTYGEDGIQIEDGCDHNTIFNNTLTNNRRNGLRFWDDCSDNIILKNTINNNKESGIVITLDSDNNNFTENSLSYNGIYGVGIHAPTCDNNLFYNNTFAGNINSHVYDAASNTKYNNSEIGNYWDDYGGVDANDDNIGDTDYLVYGSLYDELPIWWDAPVVSITTPSYMDVFGNATINFTLSITRTTPTKCNMWYMLVNNTDPNDKTGNQTFTQYPTHYILYNLWNIFENGTIKIWFFVNDSKGYIGFASVIIQKNINDPTISIIKIGFYGVGGISTINFTVALDGPDVHTFWYRINNGTEWSENYTHNAIVGQLNKKIDSTLWAWLSNGTFDIEFFLNDSISSETTKKERTFIKDVVPPSIIIKSPSNNHVEGKAPPEIEFNINEGQLHQIWYELNGTYGNYTYRDDITSELYKIFNEHWSKLGNGTVTIKFWANDTGGNVNYTILTLSLQKDIIDPNIIIDPQVPDPGRIYTTTAPVYRITSIVEPHIDRIYYTLYDGTNSFTSPDITEWYDQINQTLWDSLNNGLITITFFVIDEGGNTGYTEVLVERQVTTPTSDGVILPGGGDDDDDDDDGVTEDSMDWIIRALLAGAISGSVGITLRIAYSKIKKKREAARAAAAPTVVLRKKFQIVHHDFLTKYGKVEQKEFRVGIAQVGLSKTGNLITELYEMTPGGLMRIREDKVGEVTANIKSMVDQAHENNVNILVFPEMTFDLNYKRMVKDVKQWAQDYNMYIITGGYHDIKTKQNICAVFGPEGIFWEQEKHTPATIHFGKHVFTEAIEVHHPPHKLHICATEFGRIAIAICRDFLDMDLRVEIKNCEPPVDLFFNPAYTPVTVDFEATHFDARRAVYAYTFFTNVAEYGGACINTPEKDRTKRQIPPKEEGIIFKDVDLFSLRSERTKWERRQAKEKRYIQSTRS